MGKLTKSELECDDLYFKTLDPITRHLTLPCGQVMRVYGGYAVGCEPCDVQRCVLSDTVGFISDLPICLFAAFRATLEEASHADIVLHVIDADAQDMKRQRLEVYKVCIPFYDVTLRLRLF